MVGHIIPIGASMATVSRIALTTRIARISQELKLFAAASFVMGAAYSLIDSTLNNFLNDRFALTGFQRSFLEIPRELPGMLVVFVTALLWFFCSRRLGVVAMLLGVAGTLLIGYVSSTFAILTLCVFVYSLGQHLFMPAASAIGMELAQEGKTGQRLGQLNAIRNLAAIVGSFIVFLGFKYLNFNYHITFIISALLFTAAAILMAIMKPTPTHRARMYLKLHREYRLYYVLSVLYGSRKQLFITFAPWVIVTIFNQPTQTLATLITIGGIIGILFQPLLGWATDRLGERTILALEAVLLIFVCLGYGFVKDLFPVSTAFLWVCVFYLLDQMLMSVNMARAMYMKKIAIRPEDVQPALTVSVTLDHIFSITVALIGGIIWNAFGFQYVFLLGVFIALANLIAALKIRLPKPHTP
jgi:predicted MFS family arabinose efflux permease